MFAALLSASIIIINRYIIIYVHTFVYASNIINK